jgi:hypothetical protein
VLSVCAESKDCKHFHCIQNIGEINTMCLKMYTHFEISSSHGGEYEAQNILGCTAVFVIEC